MKFDVHIGGVTRTVEIEREADGRLRVLLDGAAVHADAVETVANTYSILFDDQAFEARVLPEGEGLLVRCGGYDFHASVQDPRAWRGARGGPLEAEGRQQVTAPMPGKVVRVLVAAGDAVQMRQGLVVVEAMKMQNEVRAPKGGQVERVFVREGQTISAGEPLVIIA